MWSTLARSENLGGSIVALEVLVNYIRSKFGKDGWPGRCVKVGTRSKVEIRLFFWWGATGGL